MDENPYKSPESMDGTPPEFGDSNAPSLPLAQPIGPIALCFYVLVQMVNGVAFVFGIILVLIGLFVALFGDHRDMLQLAMLIIGPLISIDAVRSRKKLRRVFGRS